MILNNLFVHVFFNTKKLAVNINESGVGGMLNSKYLSIRLWLIALLVIVVSGCAGLMDSLGLNEWRDLGFTQEEQAQWERAERELSDGEKVSVSFTPQVADEWRNAGLSPDEAAVWKDVLSQRPRVAGEYEKSGVSAEQVIPWDRAGFDINQGGWRPNKNVINFISIDADPEIARQLLDGGMPDRLIEEAAQNDVPAIDLIRAIESEEQYGISEIETMINLGMTPEEYRPWRSLGLPYYITRYKNAGIDPDTASVLSRNNMSAREAETLLESGIELSDLSDWGETGLSVFQIKIWADAGFDPDTASGANIYAYLFDIDPASAAQAAERCGSGHPGFLSAQPPHQASGGCFLIEGRVMQVLGANDVLVSGVDGIVALHLDEGAPSEGTHVRTLIEGGEAFSYESTTGPRIVPSGRAISF